MQTSSRRVFAHLTCIRRADSVSCAQPVAQKKGSLDSFFAKQAASSPSKPSGSTSSPKKLSASSPAPPETSTKPASKPSTLSAKGKARERAKKEEDDAADEEAINPDEADSTKLAKIEEDLQSDVDSKTVTTAAGQGKKRAKRDSGSEEEKVEVLDLCDSDGGEDGTDKPSRAKKRKRKAHDKEEKQTDGRGNEELTNFFPVVE